MIKHILAGTDLTHRSEAAIARSAELAARFDAKLTLLNVVDHDQPDRYVARELQQVNDALTEEADMLRAETHSEVTVRVVAGDPFEIIGDVAAELGADLIVLGSHRRRLLRDLFVGTTVERVIWRGTHPVLMVKRAPTGAYRRVGLATDLTEPSASALQQAGSLGLLDDVQLAVIHARTPFAKTTLVAHANHDAVQEHVNAEMQQARADVLKFLEENGRSDLKNRVYIDEGDPMTVVRGYIERTNADLVVIGTHLRRGISRMFLGSVADEALRTLDLDILAIAPISK